MSTMKDDDKHMMRDDQEIVILYKHFMKKCYN